MKTKSEIRKEVLLVRDSLDSKTICESSKKICNKIITSEVYERAKTVLAYLPIRGEVDVFPIIKDACEKKKKVYLPKIIEKHKMEFYLFKGIDDLKRGQFNILEPSGECRFIYNQNIKKDVVMIVPGVAYDKNNNRLGYGGGFYDCYLEGKDIYTIAPAYDFQILNNLMVETYDKKICEIVVEKTRNTL